MVYSIWILIVSRSMVFCCYPSDYNISGTTAHEYELVRVFGKFPTTERLRCSYSGFSSRPYSVVNLKGRWFDESKIKLYDDNTLQLVFSTTKGVVTMAAAICVQCHL